MFCNIDVDNTGIMPSFSFSHIFDQRPVLCFGVKLDNFIKKSNSPSRIIYSPYLKKLNMYKYINFLNFNFNCTSHEYIVVNWYPNKVHSAGWKCFLLDGPWCTSFDQQFCWIKIITNPSSRYQVDLEN